MPKLIRSILKKLLLLATLFIMVIVIFMLLITLADYRPDTTQNLNIQGDCLDEDASKSTSGLGFITWNIGYAGLGKEMDFFYDGGEQVKPGQDRYLDYWTGIKDFIASTDTVDFYLLQEVDVNSKRSYNFNQASLITGLMNGFCYVFATNYNVQYVPVPIMKPMGRVHAGLLTYSKYKTQFATRYAYPNIASWPENLFLLDRCFIETRYELDSLHELIVMNTHNSYYVKEDSLRQIELDIIRSKMLLEYEQGNYVIAGGDWNQNPPDLEIDLLKSGDLFSPADFNLDHDFLPDGWTYAFDKNYPTNRNVDAPYNKKNTPTTIIDFFILSPNIELIAVKTFGQNFSYSDHHPVYLRIKCKR